MVFENEVFLSNKVVLTTVAVVENIRLPKVNTRFFHLLQTYGDHASYQAFFLSHINCRGFDRTSLLKGGLK